MILQTDINVFQDNEKSEIPTLDTIRIHCIYILCVIGSVAMMGCNHELYQVANTVKRRVVIE